MSTAKPLVARAPARVRLRFYSAQNVPLLLSPFGYSTYRGA